MIHRTKHILQVLGLLERFPVVAILGARQIGKTTLARQITGDYPKPVHTFDLENPIDFNRLADPMLTLKNLEGLTVIDEIQSRPELFSVLRVLVDRQDLPCRFLILGSASPALIHKGAETLAGRIAHYELDGFSPDEIGVPNIAKLWFRGGFPRSYLADNSRFSFEWRREFVRTFLERDIPQLGINLPAITLRRFWNMLAHLQGQVWNAAKLASAFGVSDSTVRRYLDILVSTFMVRILPPWYQNLKKRQVKAPKIYFADTGLLHTLLNLPELEDLESHPIVGASWEGFCLERVLDRLGADKEECFFWATHAGAELDLLVVRGRHRLGFEFKRTTVPKITPSMRHALSDLGLDRLDVVHAGEESFPLGDRLRALALDDIYQSLDPLS